MTTLTEQLDNLYTTTWQNRRQGVADNIFDSTPFWFWMKENGRFETVNGGRRIEVNLRFAKSDNIAWIGKGGTVSLADKEFLTIAYYNWRYLVDSIVRFGVDDQQNRDKAKILNLANAKIDMSQDSLVDALETRLFGSEDDGTDFMLGLLDLVQDDPTSVDTVGGIPQDTQTWWQNQLKDLAGLSFAVHGVKWMRTMLNNCQNNLAMDRPDIIVSSQTPYEYYEDDVTEQKRIVNKKLGDAGFENIEFKGMPMIWSPQGAQGSVERMYFLNTRFLQYIYDPFMFFDMTDWKPIPNQVNDRAAQVATANQMVTNRRRTQGVIFNIDTE